MERLDPRVEEITNRAIRNMVGEDVEKLGTQRVLGLLVRERPNAFRNDDVRTAIRRLGRAVRLTANIVSNGCPPPLEECITPHFWETDLGVRVDKELERLFLKKNNHKE